MSDVFMAVLKTEAKAKEILAKAQDEAEKIKSDGELKARRAYEKIYNKEVEDAKRSAQKIIEEAKESSGKVVAKEALRGVDYSKLTKKMDAIATDIVKKLVQPQP